MDLELRLEEPVPVPSGARSTIPIPLDEIEEFYSRDRTEETLKVFEENANTKIKDIAQRILGLELSRWVDVKLTDECAYLAFSYDDHAIMVNESEFRRASLIVYENGSWLHEVAHAISSEHNPESMELEVEQDCFGNYEGPCLDSTLTQIEGFAVWLSERDLSNRFTHESLAYSKFSSEEELLEDLREWVYDDPYKLGAIIYDLAERVGGVEEVKDLALAKPRDRAEMLEKYEFYCAELGKTPIKFPR